MGHKPKDSLNFEMKTEKNIPETEMVKYSSRKNGQVRAYAANTNSGPIRNYNEDRISIILNILRPQSFEEN